MSIIWILYCIYNGSKTIYNYFHRRLKEMIMDWKQAPLVFGSRSKINIFETRVTSSSNALPPLPPSIGRAMRSLFKGFELNPLLCQKVDLVETQVNIILFLMYWFSLYMFHVFHKLTYLKNQDNNINSRMQFKPQLKESNFLLMIFHLECMIYNKSFVIIIRQKQNKK